MPVDVIETFQQQTIQHGKYNDRIYLMKFCPDGMENLASKLIELGRQKSYSKIFTKLPERFAGDFLKAGFVCEASIPRFFNGHQKACFLSYYLDADRCKPATSEINKKVMAICSEKQRNPVIPRHLLEGMTLRICKPDDADKMADLYRDVFASYPFPIDDPAYIRRTMATHVVYFGVWQKDRLIALSSAEMDIEMSNVEMTDFATAPASLDNGLAMLLLTQMEREMRKWKISTAYTIARAASFGMNITFAKMGYTFCGRLIKNTQIAGRFEDMNVWYKTLDELK